MPPSPSFWRSLKRPARHRPAGVSGRPAGGPVARPPAVEDAAGVLVGGEQPLHPLPQGGVAAARLVQERPPLGRVRLLQGGGEQRFFVHRVPPFSVWTASLSAPVPAGLGPEH